MESTGSTTPESAKAALAPELRHAVRVELERLQDWMVGWRTEHQQLLVDCSQRLQQVIGQQEIRAPPCPIRAPPAPYGRLPSKQCHRPSAESGHGLSAEGSFSAEERAVKYFGIVPKPPVHDAPMMQSDCSPLPPGLLHGEEFETPQHDLPNVVQAVATDHRSAPARTPNKPAFWTACSFESVPSAREEARAQWAEHLRRTVTEQLGSEMRMTRTGPCCRCPLIERCLAHGSACRAVVRQLVQTRVFQWCCAGIVMLNVIFAGYSTNSSMDHALAAHPSAAPMWFADGNRAFTILYSIELLLRLLAFGWAFFTGPDWKWHAFDTVLVLTSVAEELVQGVDMSIVSLRVIRVLRMARVLRIIRVMRFCRDLRLMVSSIMQSLSSLTWALLLLLMIMYVFTVVFMQGAIMYLQMPSADGEEFDEIRDGVVLWYRTLFSTMYTLLASIVGGVDWVDVVLPLEKMSMVYRFVFSFYILFMSIGVLNVLTGIFVERACELSGLDRDLMIQAQMTREEAFRLEMKRIFQEADVDCSGKISWDEFRDYLKKDRVRAYLSTQQLDSYDARTLFDMLKESEEDEIGIEAFIVGCQRLRGMAKSVDLFAVLQETRSTNRKLKALVRKLEYGRTMDFPVSPSASWGPY